MLKRARLHTSLMVCSLVLLGVDVPVARATQAVTGHAEISGKQGHVADGQGEDIFSHKNFASARFECVGDTDVARLEVTNLENRPIRLTYTDFNARVSEEIKPGARGSVEFTSTDVGIFDLSHKYATLDIDWGLRTDDNSCDFAVHTVLHFPDGTPLNG
jgi:hypothetical protein